MIARHAAVVAILVLATLLPPLAAASGGAVVIELGNTAVTRAEVDRRFAVAVRLLALKQGVALAEQDPALIEQLREQYLDKYATELVLLAEAGHRQLQVSDSQVDAALGELFASATDEAVFLDDVAINDADKAGLLRRVVRDEKTVEFLTEYMLKEIKIPPGDVITLHHDIKDTLATPEQVCVRHIQLATAEAANEVRAELEQGGSFEEIAKRRSTDAASAPMGGDLGCFERNHGAARSAFEKAAFAADEDALTGPVESRIGQHILVVYDHKMPRAPTLNEAYSEIERELAMEKLPQRIQALVSNSGVRIYLDKFTAAAD